MNTRTLRNIGLSDGDIKVYLALHKLGITTAGRLIQETRLQSSSTYHIIDSLIEKGLVSFEITNKRKRFYAISPERLLDFIDDKKKELDKEKNEVEALLPSILALKTTAKKPEQNILVFEGWAGVLSAFKEAYRQLIDTRIYAYTITKEFGGANPEQVRWLINKIRELRENLNKKRKEKIRMNIIAEKESEIGMDQNKTRFTEVRFIDKQHINPAVINIYGNVTIIALWTKTPIAFYIVSKEIAQSFKNTFEVLWKIAK